MIDAHLDAPVEPRAGNVARYSYNRRAIEPGATHAGRKISRSGTDGRRAYAGNAGQIADGRGHKARRCFARGKNKIDRTSPQRLDQRQNRPARYAEDPTYSGFLKRADDYVAIIHGCSWRTSPLCARNR